MADTKKTTKKTEVSKREPPDQPQQESIWEWIVAGLGALLVLSTVAFLFIDSFLASSPPDISVQLLNVQPSGDRYLVEFQATNRGGEGASGVNIQGDLRGTNGVMETANATISYVAAGATHSGGLYFSQDPRTLELDLYAVGYQEP